MLDFDAIATYFAEEQRYFQNHSWISSLLQLPLERSLNPEKAGPGIYHVRFKSFRHTNINQPRFEAGRVAIGRNTALKLLVFEHADMVVYVPPMGTLLDLFDEHHSFFILNHRAIAKDDVSFKFEVPQGHYDTSAPTRTNPWTQNDFLPATNPKDSEPIVLTHKATLVDDSNVAGSTNSQSPIPSVNVPSHSNTKDKHDASVANHPMEGATTKDDRATMDTTQQLLHSFDDQHPVSKNPKGSVIEKVHNCPNDRAKAISVPTTSANSLAEKNQQDVKSVAKPSPIGKSSGDKAIRSDPENKLSSPSHKSSDLKPNSRDPILLQKIVEIRDFVEKTPALSDLNFDDSELERSALFLLHLPDVSCFYVTATRILSKANWTKEHKLQDTDLQSLVLKEIAKGWTLAKYRSKSSFTRFHLALVLGAYTSIDPLNIDSVADAVSNIMEHMIPGYHGVFCAEVASECSICAETCRWKTPFFESTLESYESLDSNLLPAIFTQSIPAWEKCPGMNLCCSTNSSFRVVQEASIKIVNLQYHSCQLPSVRLHPLILGADSFTIGLTSWIACAVVIHTTPNHFYTIERLDHGHNAYDLAFLRHDNASGIQKGTVTFKDKDVIVAVVFRQCTFKPLWPNAYRPHVKCRDHKSKDNTAVSVPVTRSGKPSTKQDKQDRDTKHVTKQLKKRSGPMVKFHQHALQLSPMLKKRRRFDVFNSSDGNVPRQESSIFASSELNRAAAIPVPASDEEPTAEGGCVNPADNPFRSEDPISQFPSQNDVIQSPGHSRYEIPSLDAQACEGNQLPLLAATSTSAVPTDRLRMNFQGVSESSNHLAVNQQERVLQSAEAVPKAASSHQPRASSPQPAEEEPLGPSTAEFVDHFMGMTTEPVEPAHNPIRQQPVIEPPQLNQAEACLVPTPYAVISLFDGCGSTFHIIKNAVGYAPKVFLAAEWDVTLRAIVADALGLSLDGYWRFNRFQSKSMYLSDVDDLFKDDALVVRQFLTLLPSNCRIFVVGGSPCTELTIGSSDRGLLGLSGPASCLFFTIHLLLFLLQSALPAKNIRFLVENAGSMLPVHSDFICWTLGIQSTDVKHFLWEARTLGLADRKRFFFQNVFVPKLEVPTSTNFPFPEGWGPLPFFAGNKLRFVTAKVFMRPREELNDGLIQRSWSAYHPFSLVWNYSYFGSKEALAEMTGMSTESQAPRLPWSKIIPNMFLQAWTSFLQVITNYSSTFREKDDAIHEVLPLFHNPRVNLPFRLISASEAAHIAGIHFCFSEARNLSYLARDFVILSAVGNSFHPDLISMALGTTDQIHRWLSGLEQDVLQVVSPDQVVKAFPAYLTAIDRSIKGKTINKSIIRTPYRNLIYNISILRVTEAPKILPLQIYPCIPKQLQLPAIQTKVKELEKRRIRAIGPEVVHVLSQTSLSNLVDLWYAPQYHSLQSTTSSIMGRKANSSITAAKLQNLAALCVQNRQTFDSLYMCMWALFSLDDSAEAPASFVFVSKSAIEQTLLLVYSTCPTELYVIVQQPERFAVALASANSCMLDFHAVKSAQNSTVTLTHMPVLKVISQMHEDVLGFVIPVRDRCFVSASNKAGACSMHGCPLFFASCLFRLLIGRPDDVVTGVPCHYLCEGIPCALSYAHQEDGLLSIGKAFFRNSFGWETFDTEPTSLPLLLCLVFVATPQELQLGRSCIDEPVSLPNISLQEPMISTWFATKCGRHLCGYGTIGTFGAVVLNGQLKQWVVS